VTVADLVIVGGGQAGLAAAHVASVLGWAPVVLDASTGPGGSWPRYYDSLTLFSPARFSALPGVPFPGDPERYPVRDEVVAYLDSYAQRLDADLRWGARVERVTRQSGHFQVSTVDGAIVESRMVVAASGGFSDPAPFVGARVVVVGGGNSAVQIAVELAQVATVTIATRGRLRWQPQRILGRDFHWWLTRTGLDTSRFGPRLAKGGVPVIDDGRYRAAVRAGRPDHRPLFTRLERDSVVWADGSRERVDALILATGFRPELGYLEGTAALDGDGVPQHTGGVSTSVPGLGYVGLERQRSFASATLRGVGRDAAHVLRALERQLVQRGDLAR
jgi:putative flavoprotein involved in K+ transport